ncbi:hypothetical protein LWI28_007489 [Acer negundo]|uniref:Uncharacterized protein n=1 Tax=Acer negundo TaxID=4023 RepID=A0AAD5IDL0_ACENE|nr:hypothetical protein LWI28_007489 [Acer negundo]
MTEQLSGSLKVPSEEYLGSPNRPIKEPKVVEQIGWCDEEAGMFDNVADSDGEGTQSGFDEENDDNYWGRCRFRW